MYVVCVCFCIHIFCSELFTSTRILKSDPITFINKFQFNRICICIVMVFNCITVYMKYDDDVDDDELHAQLNAVR